MSLTPIMLCAIGVATALFTVSASAPLYVAVTSTTGGVMSGYCSIERLNIEIVPSITIAMASDMANIGREMKNLFMARYLFIGITFVPLCSFSCPVSATVSPSSTPFSTIHISPNVSPSVTSRYSAVLSGRITHSELMFCV